MSETTKWVCPECGSDRVQARMWVDANTGEHMSEDEGCYYCPACEEAGEDGSLKRLTEKEIEPGECPPHLDEYHRRDTMTDGGDPCND